MNCLDESNPLTWPDEPQRAQPAHALLVAIAAIEAAAAIAKAAGDQMPDYIDTPGSGECPRRSFALPCGCSFGPWPKAKP